MKMIPRTFAPIAYGIINSDQIGNGNHWMAFRLDARSGVVHIYNGQANEQIQTQLGRIRSQIVAGTPTRGPLSIVAATGPKQTDGSSCGVLACAWLALTIPSKASHARLNALDGESLNSLRCTLLGMRTMMAHVDI